jgi:hypothetical protein
MTAKTKVQLCLEEYHPVSMVVLLQVDSMEVLHRDNMEARHKGSMAVHLLANMAVDIASSHLNKDTEEEEGINLKADKEVHDIK